MTQPTASAPSATQASDTQNSGDAGAARDTRARRQALRDKLLAFLAIAGVCLGVVLSRAIWYGKNALARGDAAMVRGEPRTAIDHWRRAARWYVPLAPHIEDAYQRLDSLARVAEGQGDIDTALAAWRGVRHSILSTRAWYTPHEERLELANQRIAVLMVRTAFAGERAPEAHLVEREALNHQLLWRASLPSVPWVVVAFLGFAMWLGGALLFAVRAVSPDDGLHWRTAARAGALVLGGLVFWSIGLYLA